MKTSVSLCLVVLASLFSHSAEAGDFRECRVARATKLRGGNTEVIRAGSLAVTMDGKNVVLKDILADAMIYFRGANGKVSEIYQWMYNPIDKVQNRENKYLSTSYGEDVVVTVGMFDDKPGRTTITYEGTKSGNFLTMVCR